MFDKDVGVLIPTGSYGYRFGSRHHGEWTRQTTAHNLPLIGSAGQKLDEHGAVGRVVHSQTGANYHLVTLNLSHAYNKPLERFYRTAVLVEEYGLIVVDAITVDTAMAVNWRLHSQLDATLNPSADTVLLHHSSKDANRYKCRLLSHSDVHSTLEHGYSDGITIPESAIESDASKNVVHMDWQLPQTNEHLVLGCCIQANIPSPDFEISKNDVANETVVKLKVQQQIIFTSYPVI